MFVAWFVVYLLLLVSAVSQGRRAMRRSSSGRPLRGCWLLNIVSFLFLVFHAITFFDAAPQAMVVHVGRSRVPGSPGHGGALCGVGGGIGRSSPGFCWVSE